MALDGDVCRLWGGRPRGPDEARKPFFCSCPQRGAGLSEAKLLGALEIGL